MNKLLITLYVLIVAGITYPSCRIVDLRNGHLLATCRDMTSVVEIVEQQPEWYVLK